MPHFTTTYCRLIVFVAAALPMGGGAALPASAEDTVDNFAITDRNSDAFVDRGEFHQRMVEQFFFADADRDGKLVPADLPGVSAATFRGADRNGDGSLSLTEFTAARAVDFGQVDGNGDGLLSRAEVDLVSGAPGK